MVKLDKIKAHRVIKYLLLSSLFLAPSCSTSEIERQVKTDLKDPIDRELNLSREEFKDALRPYKDSSKLNKKSNKDDADYESEDDIDDELHYSPVILEPENPTVDNSRLITMSITEDVPIKDVLMELARLSDLELVLDPNIDGGIILKVKNRPVRDVIELVADQAALRYSVENGILKIQKDGPYLVSYKVDFMNMNRSSKGSYTSQTNLLSDVGSGGSSGSSGGSSGSGSSGSDSSTINSGSSYEITSNSDGDSWKSVEDNIKNVLLLTDQELYKDLDKKEATTPYTANQNANGQSANYYTINKQAGIINVMTDSKKHKIIKKYLDYVKESLSAQVLIEAKIVEVDLDDEYTAGINWNNLMLTNHYAGSLQYAPKLDNKFFSGVISSSAIEHTRKKKGIIDRTLKLLEGFGTTRTLSNPRINAINNQQAILSFAINRPYFTVTGTLQSTQTTGSTSSTTTPTITSTLHSVPLGIILTLQPSINLETQEVTMSIRPTLTTDTNNDVNDPAVQILFASASGTGDIKSAVPTIEVKELDTVLKAKSGDVMVIGGLIKHSDQNTDAGLPLISRIPILGNLTKQVTKKAVVTETVILLQATIVNGENYHLQDKKIYQTFTQDTRPFEFKRGE